MICVFQHFSGWILQHFLRISDWSCVSTYTEDIPRSYAFSLLIGNQATKSSQVYLDRLIVEDIHFNIHVDHRETWSFEDIVLYSEWLA